jgi:hypothetical protein
MKRIWIFILIYSILIGGSALIADLVDEQDGENLAGIPSSIKVSPQRKGYYEPYGLFYNPNIDMYVVFMLEYHRNHVILYSRLFSRKGRPASGFQTIAELHESDIGIVDVAYNQQDDVFFMVWEGRNYDEIKGILCDGEGWPIIPVDEAILIKKASGNDTGFWPQVTWIPATNQYAVNWMLINWRKPEDFRNGQFLSVLNSDLTFRVRKRKVRAQTMKNYLHFARILPLEDKLL